MAVSDAGTVTSKGQVTIPKRIRDKLGLTAGTDVEFFNTTNQGNGSCRMQMRHTLQPLSFATIVLCSTPAIPILRTSTG